jgi:hypothetical protein
MSEYEDDTSTDTTTGVEQPMSLDALIDQGLSGWEEPQPPGGTKGPQSPAETLETVLAGHRERWKAHGIDDAQAVKNLLTVEQAFTQDPHKTMRWLASQYNVPLTASSQVRCITHVKLNKPAPSQTML